MGMAWGLAPVFLFVAVHGKDPAPLTPTCARPPRRATPLFSHYSGTATAARAPPAAVAADAAGMGRAGGSGM